MKHILFIGSWVRDAENAIVPTAFNLWQANGVKWADLHDAGQRNAIPTPNVCVWECMRVDDAGVALLEANPNDYQILISEDVP